MALTKAEMAEKLYEEVGGKAVAFARIEVGKGEEE